MNPTPQAVTSRHHQVTGPGSFRLGRRLRYRTNDLHEWINVQHDHGGPTAA